MHDLVVNKKPCRAQPDSAATKDVVHPSYVSPSDYSGQCAWIRQVVEEQSVCLPIATVVIEGPFGKRTTEAAVSGKLSECYPYLFSSRSDMLLRERSVTFGDRVAQALRSKVRESATQLTSKGYNMEKTPDKTVAITRHLRLVSRRISLANRRTRMSLRTCYCRQCQVVSLHS